MKVKTQNTIDECPVEKRVTHSVKNSKTEIWEGIGHHNENVAYVTHNGVVIAIIHVDEDDDLKIEDGNVTPWR